MIVVIEILSKGALDDAVIAGDYGLIESRD